MHLSESISTGFYFLAPWLVFAPVIGLLINAIFGKRMSENQVGAVASLASGAAFVVSILLAYSVSINHGELMRWQLAEWIHIGNLELDWTFRIDSLSATMMLVVSGVGTLIHIYAIGYMHEDVRFKHEEGRFNRFFIYLNLFIASMMILVSGDSYLMLFVGWEGVGLCSFLLIGFWFEMDTLARPSWANSDAAKKAFVVNRIGDFGFLIAGFLMFWHLGNSFQFDNVFEAAKNAPPEIIVAITLFMLVGVAGKSAQIPLYVWLPDAMAGPTPVSALIHAATMVTAGVYLITRSFPLYNLVPEAQHIVALVGAVTALFAATIAVGQYDIKKVLAYSTISQLGFMVAAVGMGAYVAGMFHLITHAFFKALLFLSAGSVILGLERGHHHLAHANHHDEKPKKIKGKPTLSRVEGKKEEEHGHGHDDDHAEVRRVEHVETFDPGDMRNMGGMRKTMPITFWLYMIGTLALAGIFPFAGFWSKDEILLDASLHNQTVYWLLTVAAFFTAFYMGRQIWMVFFGEARTDAAKHAEESPKVMTLPLVVLAILSVAGGALNLPFKGYHNLGYWLEYTLGHGEALSLDLPVAIISTALALIAILISWLIYGRKPLKANQLDPMKKPLGFLFTGMENKWYVDEIYDFLIRTPFKKIGQFIADVIDWRFWHDFMHDTIIVGSYNWIGQIALNRSADQKGIDAFFNSWADISQWISANVRKIQNGFVRSYALSVLLGVVLILGYLILK